MVENWKMVVGVLLGTLLLVVLAAIGLSNTANKAQFKVDDLVKGASWITVNGEPKVTVVVFSDLQCPACKEGEQVARELRQTEGVRFVFRHFPLTMIHKNSRFVALVTEAARNMGKGWEMVELLFEKQSEWSEVSGLELDKLIEVYVGELGLDVSKYKELLNQSGLEEQILVDEELGKSLKLSGTPTFFVNGKMVATNLVMVEVKKLLDQK
jgi:protein-disulfide isomerase